MKRHHYRTYRSKKDSNRNNEQVYANKFDNLGDMDQFFEATIYTSSLKKRQVT